MLLKIVQLYPVPKQLITNETEAITPKQIPSINTEQTFHPNMIYRPLFKATRKFTTM